MPLSVFIGAAVGFLPAAGIYFAPDEPYKPQIVIAGTLRGLLVGLLLGFSLTGGMSLGRAAGLGALYGLLTAAVVYFAKGGPKSGDTPYLLPAAMVSGAVTGLLILWLAK